MHPTSTFWRAIAVGAVISALLLPAAVASGEGARPQQATAAGHALAGRAAG